MPTYPIVFVSHSLRDNAVGSRLIDDLRAQLGESNVRYDISSVTAKHSAGGYGGDVWRREIVRQITTCDLFLVILSPNALASEWVREEMEHAYSLNVTQGKRLLPIRYQPCVFPVEMRHWERIRSLSCRDPQRDPNEYALDVEAILTDVLLTPRSGQQAPVPPAQLASPFRDHPTIAPDHFPQRLADLGFVGRVINGLEVITPPVCAVPASAFLMGSDERHDKDAQDTELPQSPIPVAAFQIARHAVTVAEYACYTSATGQKLQDWLRQLEQPDHPVVYVSWHEATVYAAWLAQTTRQPWRLPTEAEWEKAARGTDGRIYPWGDVWDKTRANTYDGGPHTSTSVGSYPTGASPCGAQDMAGNVWEWTSSLYTPYPYNPATSEDSGRLGANGRVLRGGSWRRSPQDARAAVRIWDVPDVWDDDGGFRVCLDAGSDSA